MLLAHIAGLPIEETALSFVPVAAGAGAVAGIKLRRAFSRRRAPRLRPRSKVRQP